MNFLLSGIPPHLAMGGAPKLLQLQCGTTDRRCEPFLFFAWEEGILLPHKIKVGPSISVSWTT
jgi:hypothetical protein